MGLLDKIFRKSKRKNDMQIGFHSGENNCFDSDEYSKYNDEKINEFKNKYDLTTIEGIKAIPISEAKEYPDGGKSVVYMPEQILNRQATEYKNEKKYDLAIECLRKANELYPYSFYAYTRDNYERIVDFMILAERYDDARKEHKYLDDTIGSKLEELKKLQDHAVAFGTVTAEEYYNRIIKPYIEESRYREQYYWLLEHYPNIAPKSFGGYRKMKRIQSDNYKKIYDEIKKNGYDIDNVTFWE